MIALSPANHNDYLRTDALKQQQEEQQVQQQQEQKQTICHTHTHCSQTHTCFFSPKDEINVPIALSAFRDGNTCVFYLFILFYRL